eukprot:TRINITY_DN11468_c0_g1_i1.p1 TRINITY_DN11468_c0_g1~~TRINITY_DN11468_c0_g1_i1.p1  ORF type:complete len:999 (+),score=35.81 TRINITY_DN11468_c0_g1_i1:98-3094(+)
MMGPGGREGGHMSIRRRAGLVYALAAIAAAQTNFPDREYTHLTGYGKDEPTLLGMASCDPAKVRDVSCACATLIVEGFTVTVEPWFDTEDTLLCNRCTALGMVLLPVVTHQHPTGGGDMGFLQVIGASLLLTDVLQSMNDVKFRTTNPEMRTRSVSFAVGIGQFRSGSFWKPVGDPARWSRAQQRCAASTYLAAVGYLATLTDAAEESIPWRVVKDSEVFLGLTNYGSPAGFRWVTGPEGCPPYAAASGPEASSCDIYPLSANSVCAGSGCNRGTLSNWEPPIAIPPAGAFVSAPESARDSRDWRADVARIAVALCEYSEDDICHDPENVVYQGRLVTAVIDECSKRPWNRCLPADQECFDPDHSILGDYVCRCRYGSGNSLWASLRGTEVTPQMCDGVVDECEHACATCESYLCRGAYQKCVEVDLSVPSDWMCECLFSPDTALEEPRDQCLFDFAGPCDDGMAGAVLCRSEGQGCTGDPPGAAAYAANMFPEEVVAPSAVGVRVTYGLGEGDCSVAGATCSVGSCVPPTAGRITAFGRTFASSIAVCVFDVAYPAVQIATIPPAGLPLGGGHCEADSSCEGVLRCWRWSDMVAPVPMIAPLHGGAGMDMNFCYAKQRAWAVAPFDIGEGPCIDDADCLGTLECFRRPATGPFAFRAIPGVQTDPNVGGNVCYRPFTHAVATVTAEWECTCRSPTTGTPVLRGRATCELDECTASCVSCATGCISDGVVVRFCSDPNHDPFSILDWVCNVTYAGKSVAATGRVPHIQEAEPEVQDVDECTASCPTCWCATDCPAGRCTCRETSLRVLDDWVCDCTDEPATSSAPGGSGVEAVETGPSGLEEIVTSEEEDPTRTAVSKTPSPTARPVGRARGSPAPWGRLDAQSSLVPLASPPPAAPDVGAGAPSGLAGARLPVAIVGGVLVAVGLAAGAWHVVSALLRSPGSDPHCPDPQGGGAADPAAPTPGNPLAFMFDGSALTVPNSGAKFAPASEAPPEFVHA